MPATVTGMRRWWFPSLVVWTAYVWITRIVNVWSDPVATRPVQVGSTLLAGSLLVPAAVLGVGWLTGGRQVPWRHPYGRVLTWFGVWTTVVWCVRVPMIALGPHDLPFKLVHAALGVISIVLVAVVLRQRTDDRAEHRHAGRAATAAAR